MATSLVSEPAQALKALREQALRILVVEDDVNVRRYLTDLAETQGLDVRPCDDGADALATYLQDGVDIVMTDWMMPGMDGLELCRRIRATEQGNLPVILVLTARGEREALDAVLAAGADDYLVKPASTGQLRSRLAIAAKRAHGRIVRRQVQVALRTSEERYALAARGSNDGLWDWDLNTEEIYFSERWKAIVGMSNGEVGRTPSEWFERVHPADRDRVRARLDGHLTGETELFECSYRIRHRDGTFRWVLSRGIAVRNETRPCRIAGSLTDLSERGVHDELTGLPNRTLFRDRLRVAAARQEPGTQYAVMLIDLDRFKNVNEGLGHALGDQLLIAVTRRLESNVRSSDAIDRADTTLARTDGDEFVLLLEQLKDANHVEPIAKRIQASLNPAFDLDGHEVHTSASIGIAISRSGRDGQDLMREAGIALHQAKTLGKGQVQIFDPAMLARFNERLATEHELRHAIERDELRVVYQPILDLATLAVTGFEALMRWQHEEKGLVAPDNFIPVAEDTGLILSLDRWMLESVCRQLCLWEEQGAPNDFTVSVNLSSRHFAAGDIAQDVKQILKATGCRGERVKLEITETSLIENPDSTAIALEQLKKLGVRICVDDFGTGYSSLSHLHRFPLDVIKIDRSFVAEMVQRGREFAIVQAVVSLAADLGMDVVAEGVETQEQLDRLREMGCQHGQGFFFSKPRLAADVAAWHAEHGARKKLSETVMRDREAL
jgi:diguanylate cyclase (GGDEF)-like protein/PAS domain S-box-containing protein